LRAFDPSLAATFTTSETVIDNTLKRQQLGMTLMLAFGATTLAVAAIGLYRLIAYAAAQRRGELATRIALGASGRQVFWLMMSGGQRLMAIWHRARTVPGLCRGTNRVGPCVRDARR
jgi:hypothetical protein